jgi:hypothetical protein
MKVYFVDTVDDREYEKFIKKLEVGDIEVTSQCIWATLGESNDSTSGPHFSGLVAVIAGVHSEDVSPFVHIVANTEITQKLYKDRIWKQNKEWLIVKK